MIIAKTIQNNNKPNKQTKNQRNSKKLDKMNQKYLSLGPGSVNVLPRHYTDVDGPSCVKIFTIVMIVLDALEELVSL